MAKRNKTFGVEIDRGWIGKIKKGDIKTIFLEGLLYIGEYWHRVYFPERFEPQGQNTYHLQQRGSKYVKMTKKRYSNWRPLNRTGRLMRFMSANYSVKASVNAKGAIVSVKIRRPFPTQEFVAGELVKVNKNESKTMIQKFKTFVIEKLQEFSTNKAA